MDTRLRKSHKLTTLIIALCVVIPALILVSLYPRMEKAMLEKKEYYQQLNEEKAQDEPEWVVVDNFTNYAMEFSYYAYAKMLDSTMATDMDYSIFNRYGWDTDYWYVYENASFIATYSPEEGEPIVQKNVEEFGEPISKLTIVFDANGLMTEVTMTGATEMYDEIEGTSVYQRAERSMLQFKDNVIQMENEKDIEIDEAQYVPKNFKVEFVLAEDSEFIYDYAEYFGVHGWYDTSAENLYFEIGAYWIVLLLALFVAVAALTLPFIKILKTGKEKLFSIPLEVMIPLAFCAFFLVIGMCFVMAETSMWGITNIVESHGLPEILGSEIGVETLYFLALAANFVGWTVGFLLIYVVFANLRQFISNTKYYIKYQVLTVRFFRWIKKKCIQLYRYVTDIDIREGMNSSIIKIVLANFVILTILCCMWFFGVAGLIIYSIVLYVILKEQGKKIQKQYCSVLHATEQMADGELKISLEEDLGVFQPIGDSLEKVQQGFEKAVVEEAKSQSMKTELITNVSHDLKTPLTAIITYVDLLKKEDITEEERQSYIATLEQKSQRLKILIEDLFEVSKAHSGNVKMNFMDIDVVSLLKQVRSEMDEQIQCSDLQFRWNLPEEKLILPLDGQRTYRVFENLLNNILKYAMPYSRVYIDVIPTTSQVQIQFRNVSAMELDFDAERLTERFVRGDSARNSEGSGLGLAIVKSFVELQKGTFRIEVDGDLFKAIITFDK